jgi:hypothetical protein
MFRRRRFCGPSSFHHHFIAVHDAYSRIFDRGVRRSAAVRAQRPRPRMSGTAIPTIKERVGRTFTFGGFERYGFDRASATDHRSANSFQ